MSAPTLVANARMYAVTPAVAGHWRDLFAWLSARTGGGLAAIDHPAPAPLDALWARADMGCVFMCGWPYGMAAPRPQLVAAPVPAPARYFGRPVYTTDLVARADGPVRRLEDSFGGTLAWTVEHSHSGYNAVRHHLLPHRTAERPTLYARTVGPVVTPRAAIDAVLSGRADVAPLDGFCHDLLRAHDPAAVAGLRTVATTAPAPFPPLVASPGVEPGRVARMRDALLDAASDPAIRPTLDALLLSGFAAVEPADYAVITERADEAIAAGYAAPG